MIIKDKVRGMMYGVAIGDALGQPYEMKPPLGHPVKTYKDSGGFTTDDWQLSAAVAKALMKGNGFDMAVMVQEHVNAYKDGTRGWGGAHRNACAALAHGMDPADTGLLALDPANPYRGRGNGMCMKISPLAAYHLSSDATMSARVKDIIPLAQMTHKTGLGLSSALAMEEAVIYCLESTPVTFDPNVLLKKTIHAAQVGERCTSGETNPDLLSERLSELLQTWKSLTPEDVIEKYKGGGYVYESLPFSLAFMCMGKHDVCCVYDCVGCGGDTDTNGSMVAAMVGSLHGEQIFSRSLLYKLNGFADIELLCEAFASWCDKRNPNASK